MMHTAVDKFDRASGRMASDLRTMINDGEDLLKAAAAVSDEGFVAARAKFEEKLNHAKAALADASQPALERTKEAAAATDKYVRANPWAAVGVAVAGGVLLGFIAAKN
jgi:ElaB/YqjD/DUF883 family membrane-anchored ribosome-binding protein